MVFSIFSMNNYSKIISILLVLLFFNGCQNGNFFKRSDVKDNPVNVDERVQKNIDEGRGIRFGKLGKGQGGTFVCVGALHLLGEKGVLSLLEKQYGFEIKRIKFK